MINVAQKNIAPSADHPDHDVYSFSVVPGSDKPFVFEQSIGGGHSERGGATLLSLSELNEWPGDWRQHLYHSGCSWVIAVLEAVIPSADSSSAVESILAGLSHPGGEA
ncbi:hypothetical protein [Lysobacter sp. Root667]|uniref:hypothetical protein n=1 Tax=Lysobacter sp. Root667 TaxID=1736581 RepID=UPI0009E7FE6B|nr:hypothetical protein [Lysobacter sp. Root667]